MEDQGIIIIGSILLISFILIYAASSKSQKQKDFENKQKMLIAQEENLRKYREQRRLEKIAAEKEEERLRKLEDARKKQDELIKKGKLALNSMSKLVSDSTTKFRKNIDKKISQHYLTSFSWVMINSQEQYVLFTFRSSNELLITKNGNVEKAKYEILGQNQSILIYKNDNTEHFNFINLNNDYFFLNKVSTYDVYAFVNQDKYKDDSRDWFVSEINKLKKQLKSDKA